MLGHSSLIAISFKSSSPAPPPAPHHFVLFLNAWAVSSSLVLFRFQETGGSQPKLLQKLQGHEKIFFNSWNGEFGQYFRGLKIGAIITGKGELAVETGPVVC